MCYVYIGTASLKNSENSYMLIRQSPSVSIRRIIASNSNSLALCEFCLKKFPRLIVSMKPLLNLSIERKAETGE